MLSQLKETKQRVEDLKTMVRPLVRMRAKMLHQLLTGSKLLPTLCTLECLVSCRSPCSTSVVLGVDQPMGRQLLGGREPTATLADVWPPVAMQDEMFRQLRRIVVLHVTPRAVEQLHGDDAVHLNRLQPRRRLYVTIEMLGQLRLERETLVADFALVRQFLVYSRR